MTFSDMHGCRWDIHSHINTLSSYKELQSSRTDADETHYPFLRAATLSCFDTTLSTKCRESSIMFLWPSYVAIKGHRSRSSILQMEHILWDFLSMSCLHGDICEISHSFKPLSQITGNFRRVNLPFRSQSNQWDWICHHFLCRIPFVNSF